MGIITGAILREVIKMSDAFTHYYGACHCDKHDIDHYGQVCPECYKEHHREE